MTMVCLCLSRLSLAERRQFAQRVRGREPRCAWSPEIWDSDCLLGAALPSDPSLHFPPPEAAEGFPKWALAWWLFYYVEDALQRLPLVLLAPTVGAVIGTSLAVSDGSSVTIEGHAVAAVPSFWDVLGPAVGGAVGGIVLLALGAAVWGRVSYARGGDDVWVATLHEQWGLILLCRNEDVPADPSRLGAVECIVKRPSGEFDRTDALPPFPGRWPHGLIATGIRGLGQAGNYEARWYATEHRARLHEVARMPLTGPVSTGQAPTQGPEGASGPSR